MPSLQTSGPISILNVKNLFGGPTSPAMSNYYRGGTYLPSSYTTSVLTYDPSGGGFTAVLTPATYWVTNFYDGTCSVYWGGAGIGTSGNVNATVLTFGIYTYYRGTYGVFGSDTYSIRRTYMNTVTTQINTGVPSSGQISMSQFYGATTGT